MVPRAPRVHVLRRQRQVWGEELVVSMRGGVEAETTFLVNPSPTISGISVFSTQRIIHSVYFPLDNQEWAVDYSLMGALKSTHCSRGHRMEPSNLYMRGDGKRECLTCKRERNRGRKSDAVVKDRGSVSGGLPVSGNSEPASRVRRSESKVVRQRVERPVAEVEHGPEPGIVGDAEALNLCKRCKGQVRKGVCWNGACVLFRKQQGRM